MSNLFNLLVDGRRIVAIGCRADDGGRRVEIAVEYGSGFGRLSPERIVSDCLRDNRRILRLAKETLSLGGRRSIDIASFAPWQTQRVCLLQVRLDLTGVDPPPGQTAPRPRYLVRSPVAAIEAVLLQRPPPLQLDDGEDGSAEASSS